MAIQLIETHRFTKWWLRLFSILVIVLLPYCSWTQSENLELSVGSKLSKTIKLGDSDNYELDLKKHQFVLINLKQQGIDLKITTFTPEGTQIEEFDSPNGSSGNEIILIDVLYNGLYRIEVSTLGENKREKKGNYEIELISIHNSVESHLNEALKTLYNRKYIPGFGVSIVNSKKILYHKAMGYANIKDNTPYTTETVQSIASISKTFIGLSLMKLVEQNKITLDTPINKLLPFKVTNPHFPNKPITIRHLATHTSSINEESFYHKAYILLDKEAVDKYDYNKHFKKELNKAIKNEKMPMPEFLKRYLSEGGKGYKNKIFFNALPGENWYYSNTGAALAAYIVELVSGESYNEFIKNHIIKPLNLKSTTWSQEVKKDSTLAIQYDIKGNPLPKRTIITYPDGEIYTNITDLSTYLMTFIKGNLGESNFIGNTSFKEMMKVQHKQKEGKFKGRKDGLFWEFSRSGVMGHSGGDSGVSAFMYFDPTSNLGFTYMCNIMPTESNFSNAESRSIWFALKRYAPFFN